MAVSLAEATLPALAVGKSASFDFKSLTTITGGPGMGAVVYYSEWLPDGLELSDDGVLSGRPAEGGEFRIVVIAIYSQSPSVIGPQSYLVQIGQGGGRN